MKAFLIDPEEQTVSEVEVADGNDVKTLHSMYELMKCYTIEAINPLNAGRDVIYLDENGKQHPNQFFSCRLWPYERVLAGRALWIGCDGEGGNQSPEMKIDYVRDHIMWLIPTEDTTHLAPGIFILHGKHGR